MKKQFTGSSVRFKSDNKYLIQRLREYELILESAGEGIYGLDTEGHTTFANRAAAQMIGYELEDLIGKRQHDILHHSKSDGSHYPSKECPIYAAFKDGKVHRVNDEVFWKKDGTSFPVEYISTPIIDEKGTVLGAVVLFKDLSRQKKDEIKLKTSKELYKNSTKLLLQAQEVAKMAFIDWNLKTDKMTWSDHLYDLYKNDLDIHNPNPNELLKIVHPDDKEFVDENLKLAISGEKEYNIDHRHLLKTGEVQWVHAHAELFRDAHGNPKRLLGTVVDITERKEIELELINAYEEIKELRDNLKAENVLLKKSITTNSLNRDIVGNSEQIKSAISTSLQVAPLDTTVLIIGETGTGKELFAKGIHNASSRKDQTLVTINCAAIPEPLLESELFGHEKGAFTNAHQKKIGVFEVANKSSIFLDEIGELSLSAQTKLLRVIESKEIYRLGNTKPIKVNVRIITATNRDLKELVNKNKFRKDLFYRLNVYPIELPPLRTRKSDIKILVEKFVGEFNIQMGKQVKNISSEALDTLEKYSWPGNVRELKNIVERSMIASFGKSLQVYLNHYDKADAVDELALEDIERNHIVQILKTTNWKVSGKGGAAEILGLNPSTLRSKIRKLKINRPK